MITVAIGEHSYIIRKGILQLLSEFSEVTRVVEFATPPDLEKGLAETEPEIIIANTYFDLVLRDWINQCETEPIILYLYHSPLPMGESPNHLSVFEDKTTLLEKIQLAVKSCSKNLPEELGEELSPREKLVLKQVALGNTNKEIADTLFISTHTVISHRKNITKKLGIKTVSGLTVYAILNKLIGIEDIS